MSGTTKITAESSVKQLPTDVKTLQQMVLTLLGQIDDLTGQLYYLKRQLFGKKSEKLNPAQRLLFENLYNEVQAKIEEKKQTKSENVQPVKNANHNGRRPLPAELKREVIEIEPAEEEKVCSVCNNEKQRIGFEETEKLEYEPASFYVKRYVRHKYVCKQCEGNISIGQLPAMAIDKGIPGEGLLAHIITSKYADHAPLNRLEGILKRHGVDITVSNMCDWVGKSAELLEPLVTRMHELILLSPKINTDDTQIPVKCANRKGSTYNGYLWVYIDNKHDEVFRKTNATEIGCNSHARRKFEYALDSDPVRAARMMVLWGRLYEIESRAKKENYSDTQLLEAGQKEARPIFAEIKAVLNEYKDQVLPKCPMGKAITYAMNQWEALNRYTDDPTLEIDNNLSERVLRMVVIGRRNYMFAGSETGAERAAIIYSLVASCKLHGHDPFEYFRDVLKKVSTHPQSRIDELLPCNWKPPLKKAKIAEEDIAA